VNDLARRVHWRCRELGTSLAAISKSLGLDRTTLHRDLSRPELSEERFKRLTDALRMDEVNGWYRPFPVVPKTTPTLAEALEQSAMSALREEEEDAETEADDLDQS